MLLLPPWQAGSLPQGPMTPSPKLEGGTHRLRVRAPGAAAADRDALHALLAIASAAQQEGKKPPQKEEQAIPAAPEKTVAARAREATPEDALKRMAESVRAITEASGVAIAVARGAEMVCVASAGKCAIEVGASIDLDRGLAGRCVRTGELQNCPDSENDARVNREACRELGVRSMVMVPLRRRRQMVAGVLSVFSDGPARFSPRNLRFLEFMAGLVLEAAERGQPEAFPPPVPPQQAAPLRLTVALATASAHSDGESREILAVLGTRGPWSRQRIAGLALLLAVLALAALLWMGWPQMQNWLHPPASPPPAAETRAPETAPATAPQVSPESQAAPEVAAAASPEPPAVSPAADGRARLTAVHYSSVPGGTRVVLELDRVVRYQASRLDNPSRLFLDLEDTHLALAGRSIPADDPLLRSIRVAQYRRDVARVVLDLEDSADYSATLQPDPPRLVIELRAPAGPK